MAPARVFRDTFRADMQSRIADTPARSRSPVLNKSAASRARKRTRIGIQGDQDQDGAAGPVAHLPRIVYPNFSRIKHSGAHGLVSQSLACVNKDIPHQQ